MLTDEENRRRGHHQFAFLIENGLLPTHSFLDIGYGPKYDMRAARFIIDYLQPRKYTGIDKDPAPASWLTHAKCPTLIERSDFAFPDQWFDMAWAQSVFTHLGPGKLMMCLESLAPILAGPFFATFMLADVTDLGKRVVGSSLYRSTRYSTDLLHAIASAAGMSCEIIGDWGHWHGQQMVRFDKESAL